MGRGMCDGFGDGGDRSADGGTGREMKGRGTRLEMERRGTGREREGCVTGLDVTIIRDIYLCNNVLSARCPKPRCRVMTSS